MGYWGYFVVGRAERPLAELDALAGAEGLIRRAAGPAGRPVWEYPGADRKSTSQNTRHPESNGVWRVVGV
ncbi:hypothetical protein ACLMMR_42655, partial [Streptomyces sp. NPDC000405]